MKHKRIAGTVIWVVGVALLLIGVLFPIARVYPKPANNDNGHVSEDQSRLWRDMELTEAMSRESLIRDDSGNLIDTANDAACES